MKLTTKKIKINQFYVKSIFTSLLKSTSVHDFFKIFGKSIPAERLFCVNYTDSRLEFIFDF